MKIFLILKDGEQIELTEAEALNIPDQLENNKFVKISRLNRIINSYKVDDIKSFSERTCESCGVKYYENVKHYCNYIGLDDMLESDHNSPNLTKLREQSALMKKGKYTNEDHKRIWGHDIPRSEFSLSELRDINSGIAKVCYDKNGKKYCGYIVSKLALERNKRFDADTLSSKEPDDWYTP